VLRKFSSNAYELEIPSNIGIYPIFNVSDLYPFKETQAIQKMHLIMTTFIPLIGRNNYL
jgi:hypothetical protein